MDINIIERDVNSALDKLYTTDQYLFENGLCERCIAHKFAQYLEVQTFCSGYFVDCEYNRAYSARNGGIRTKKVTSKDGNSIDIVVTKRNDNPEDDLVCFEVKKWNNADGQYGFEEDRQKLRILTGNQNAINKNTGEILVDDFGQPYCFNYQFGFFIIFGPNRENVVMEKFFRDK